MRRVSSWWAGVAAALPLAPGLVGIGILYGTTAIDAGMPPATVIGTSLMVATGTTQFMAVELMEKGTAWWLVVLLGLIVNARFAVYGLHLGPFASSLPRLGRWSYCALVTDVGYAMSTPVIGAARPGKSEELHWSAGVMVIAWLAWQTGTVLGATLGQILPLGLSLDVAIPLTLLAVLVLLIRTRRHLLVAAIAGISAFLLKEVPWGLGALVGLLVGALSGSALSAARPAFGGSKG